MMTSSRRTATLLNRETFHYCRISLRQIPRPPRSPFVDFPEALSFSLSLFLANRESARRKSESSKEARFFKSLDVGGILMNNLNFSTTIDLMSKRD